MSGISGVAAHGHWQERLDIEIVGGQDDLEKHLLVDSDKLLIPFADIGGAFASFVLWFGVCGRKSFTSMMFAVFEDLYEHKTLKGEKDTRLLQPACLPFSKRLMRHWAVVWAGHSLRRLKKAAL
jgi:hypothetical protein